MCECGLGLLMHCKHCLCVAPDLLNTSKVNRNRFPHKFRPAASHQGGNRERGGQNCKDQHDSAGNPVMSSCVYGSKPQIEQCRENLDHKVSSCYRCWPHCGA